MTKTEFENLKFGDKVYDEYGYESMVVGLIKDEQSVRVIAEDMLEANDIRFEYLFLEKPKKKVTVTKEYYITDTGLGFLNQDLSLLIYPSTDNMESNIPITVIYETEEE